MALHTADILMERSYSRTAAQSSYEMPSMSNKSFWLIQSRIFWNMNVNLNQSSDNNFDYTALNSTY